MIIVELIAEAFKCISYLISRPIIWVITARDCRHCIYGRLKSSGWYYSSSGWYCSRNYQPDVYKCKDTPWRCGFKRRTKG